MLMDMSHRQSGFLVRSASANGVTGSALDCLLAPNYGILTYSVGGNSAIWDLMVAADNSIFVTALSVTSTAASSAQLQISAYYPYIKAGARLIYSAAGGSAVVTINYTPGIRS